MSVPWLSFPFLPIWAVFSLILNTLDTLMRLVEPCSLCSTFKVNLKWVKLRMEILLVWIKSISLFFILETHFHMSTGCKTNVVWIIYDCRCLEDFRVSSIQTRGEKQRKAPDCLFLWSISASSHSSSLKFSKDYLKWILMFGWDIGYLYSIFE